MLRYQRSRVEKSGKDAKGGKIRFKRRLEVPHRVPDELGVGEMARCAFLFNLRLVLGAFKLVWSAEVLHLNLMDLKFSLRLNAVHRI